MVDETGAFPVHIRSEDELQAERVVIDRFNGLGESDIFPVLKDSLSGTSQASPQFDIVSTGLSKVVSVETARQLCPPTVNLDSFVQELTGLNSPDFWKRLTSASTSTLDPDLVVRIGNIISDSNRNLFETAIVYVGLAALYGSHFKQLINNLGKYTRSSYQAAEKISETFPDRVDSVNDLLDRLRVLFNNRSDNSAFKALVRGKAFEQLRDDDFLNKCPALPFTGSLFSAYGNILKDEDYVQRFKQRIEANSSSV